MAERKYILPQTRSINATDCKRLLEAIRRGEIDEFDLKNEINAQWANGYGAGVREEKNRWTRSRQSTPASF